MATTEQPDIEAVHDALKINYNTTGVAVMQAMYCDDYLSLGGPESTGVLAKRAGITSDLSVLDIGCGIGGPAIMLAESIGCHVTGIDLIDTSIEIAKKKAEERGLAGRTQFQAGDATALPFAGNSFDVVFGQDAWCHVPDKQTLISEGARVLRPGGVMAFTDWLRLDDNMDAEMQVALEAALSQNAVVLNDYLALLSTNGLERIETEDLSERFTQSYREIYARFQARREALVEQFNERIFDIVGTMNAKILAGFEQRRLGGALFVAHKPG